MKPKYVKFNFARGESVFLLSSGAGQKVNEMFSAHMLELVMCDCKR